MIKGLMFSGVEVLGDVPLSLQVREGADSGRPVVVTNPNSPQVF